MSQIDSEIIFENASNLYKDGKHDDALEIFDNELVIQKNEFNFSNNNGCFFLNLKKYDQIIQHFDKILETNPDDHEILARKGLSLEILSKYDEALLHFDKALQLDPDNVIAIRNKGILLMNIEKYDQAIQHFDKILETNPDDYDMYLGKGLALEMLGKSEDAVSFFINAFQINTNDSQNLSTLSFHIVHFCGPTNALSYSNQILKTNPDNLLAKNIMHLATSNQDKLKAKIIDFYQKYVHREPDINDMNYWIEQILQGKSVIWIEDQIKNSEEGKNYWN